MGSKEATMWKMKILPAICIAGCLALAGCNVPSDLPQGGMAYGVIPPEEAVAGQAQYRLGPQDTLSINVFREPEVSVEAVQIDPAGNIDLPLIGPIRAEGYSPAQLSGVIEQALTRYVRNPQVAVSLTQIGQTIAVEGLVGQPGLYPVPGRLSLIEALALAGSPTEFADTDRIFVFREIDGRRAGARFDIRRIRAGLDPDPLILPGDRIAVGENTLGRAWQNYLSAPIFNVFRAF
ncbi:MAG: polysaccharide biosynthesis/export family protein [Alteripontixanthobacter sp.]